MDSYTGQHRVAIKLFAGPILEIDGCEKERTRQESLIFAYLICQRHGAVTRHELIEAAWPEEPPLDVRRVNSPQSRLRYAGSATPWAGGKRLIRGSRGSLPDRRGRTCVAGAEDARSSVGHRSSAGGRRPAKELSAHQLEYLLIRLEVTRVVIGLGRCRSWFPAVWPLEQHVAEHRQLT